MQLLWKAPLNGQQDFISNWREPLHLKEDGGYWEQWTGKGGVNYNRQRGIRASNFRANFTMEGTDQNLLNTYTGCICQWEKVKKKLN